MMSMSGLITSIRARLRRRLRGGDDLAGRGLLTTPEVDPEREDVGVDTETE
jgi:hypothetical protein